MPPKPGETRADPKTAMYSNQWGCKEQFASGLLHVVSRIRDRRYAAVDEERGAGPTTPWTWELAEMFKLEKGKIHRIEAILERASAASADVTIGPTHWIAILPSDIAPYLP